MLHGQLPPQGLSDDVPALLKPALQPMLEAIAGITQQIRAMTWRLEKLADERYEETKVLRQIKGVGPLTSLGFVLTLEEAQRFGKSRSVGAFLGLTPRQHDSGESQPQLRITKAGDPSCDGCSCSLPSTCWDPSVRTATSGAGASNWRAAARTRSGGTRRWSRSHASSPCSCTGCG